MRRGFSEEPETKIPCAQELRKRFQSPGASSAAPQQAVPVRRMKTPHAEMKGATRSIPESMQKAMEIPRFVKVVEQAENKTEMKGAVKIRINPESIQKVTETPCSVKIVEQMDMELEPEAKMSRVQKLKKRFQPPSPLCSSSDGTSISATPRLVVPDGKMMTPHAEMTMDRNTTRALESMRDEVERILTEKLAVLQSQLQISQHAAPPPEEVANNQASLQAISEKMQSLMTSFQNVEASRKQDLEILRAEMQVGRSRDLEAAKKSSSEEKLMEIEKKRVNDQRKIEELQAPGRRQGDADIMESLKKENELLHAQRYKVDVTLDADTAHPRLQVSKDGKTVTDTGAIRRVPSKKERFDSHTFVLAKEGYASGRLYWEVDVGKRRNWTLGVAQETVTRKGTLVLSPQNGFWAIGMVDGREYWAYTDPWTRLTVSGRPRKIGIFLDISAKKLLFYNVHQKNALYTFSFHNDCSQEMKLFPFFSTGPTATQFDTEPLQIAQGFDDDEK